MSKYKIHFDRNIGRVNSLCNLYKSLREEDIKEGKDYKFTDILRSAVVMLHSSFEEYFRNVLLELLPQVCDEDDLKDFSFAGSNGKHRSKVTLGQLLEYKDQSVKDLIINSISEELYSTSFNNYRDISNWAQKARVDLTCFSEAAKLEQVIKRRHKIVHEADNSRDNSEYALTQIRENTVRDWISVVCQLVDVIEQSVEENNGCF